MKKLLPCKIIFWAIILLHLQLRGQVGMNLTGSAPDPSAMLDVSAINRGLLVPRMTTAQRNAINNPAEGLQIYNLDCHIFNYFNGTEWAPLNTLVAGVSIAANQPGALCSGAYITFTASPANGGASPGYQWIVNGSDVGTDSATYSYTPGNGDVVSCIMTSNSSCGVTGSPVTSNSITIAVNPVPTLSSSLNPPVICSGSVFNYTPAGTVAGTAFNWSRAAVNGISNAAATGTGNPAETLIDTTFAPVNVTYTYILTANGCSDTQNVTVSVSPPITTNGLIGYWPFNGNSNDLSGNGNNGTDYNMAYGNAYGVYGEGADFNGGSSYIDVGNAAVLHVNSYTISVWLNFNTPNSEFRIFSNGGYGNVNGAIDFGMGSSNGAYTNRLFLLNQNNGSQDVYRLNMSLTANTWYYLAATYDSATLTPAYYVNGQPVGGTFDNDINMRNPNPNPSYNFHFALSGNNSGGYYNGYMDEARFYNRALSATEIENIYNATCQ